MTVTPLPVPPAPSRPSIFKRALNGFLAAATSAAAIKGEKNLAVIVATGVLLSVGASAGLVNLVTSLINGL